MMIVSVTRDDLRDEFVMADEAFALSPISARAAQPSEEDYDAISQAFMETSRGRWFLGEYAKRNRNADTRMVLDAVARIEETLAAQKQPAADNGLTEALAAIRDTVDEAQGAAAAAVESLASEENLAPVRKGARIVREISWRWREIGADSRICDLLDSQVAAIEDACGQISSTSPQAALSASFDLIRERIAGFDDDDKPSSQAVEAAAPLPSAAAPNKSPVAAVATLRAVSTTDDTETAMSSPAEAVFATAEAVNVAAEVTDGPAEAPDVTYEAVDENPEAADAYDEALLDMVALEMAAPDPDDIDDASDAAAGEAHVEDLPPAEAFLVAREPEPMPAPAAQPRGSFTSTFTSTFASSLVSTFPWLDASRQRNRAGAHRIPARSAGPDPAHEPGREDRILLVS